jgi:hypothetical protein
MTREEQIAHNDGLRDRRIRRELDITKVHEFLLGTRFKLEIRDAAADALEAFQRLHAEEMARAAATAPIGWREADTSHD